MTNHIRFLTSLALTSALLGVATLIGGYLYLKPGLPDVESLRTVKLQTPLQIFTSDGQLIAQLGEKYRDPVIINEETLDLVRAFLDAKEDKRVTEKVRLNSGGRVPEKMGILPSPTRIDVVNVSVINSEIQ